MKKILVIGSLVAAIAIAAWAAAPVAITTASVKAADTLTTSNVYGGTWKNVTNCIYGLTDSATVLMRVTGIAKGNPGSKLYVGFSTDSAGATAGPTLDTAVFTFPPSSPGQGAGGQSELRFALEFATTYSSQTDIVDTIYFKFANGANSQSDVTYLYDVCAVVQVGDKSAAFN